MQERIRYPADWIQRKRTGPPITMVTAYDASMAALVADSPIDAILVGDSLGMVIQGHGSTTPVTLEQLIYHTGLVRRGAPSTFIVADMPFGSYHTTPGQGIENGIRLFQQSGADALKLEGATPVILETVRGLVGAGIPVMGHTGLTPQSYRTQGGFRIQGRDPIQAAEILDSARQLEAAGAFALLLEMVVDSLAGEITRLTSLPTIGIGAGNQTTGQVLVWHDLLGLNASYNPKYLKKYANLHQEIQSALTEYDREVKEKIFPGPENSFGG